MYNKIMNRDLFQRYARQPQAPAAPSGIMASSPELMQASMRYQQGGMVQPSVIQPRVNPQFRPDLVRFQQGGPVNASSYSDPFLNPPAQAQVDITQTPTEFKESITEPTVPTMFGFTEEGVNQEVQKLTTTPEDPMAVAMKAGEAAIESGLENVPPELQLAADTLVDPKTTPTEETEEILKGMGKDSPKGTKGKISAMKALISDTFGVDASRYDNLRALNRAAVGFAIAEGGDIATALKQGVQGSAAIEEKQLAREDEITGMAVSQVFAEKAAAAKAAAKSPKSWLETPEGEAVKEIYQNHLKNNKSPEAARASVNEIAPGLGDKVAAAISNSGAVDITQPAGSPVKSQIVEFEGNETVAAGNYRVYSDGRPAERIE